MPELLNLNGVVLELETMLRPLIGEDVVLATALDPALGPIEADPGQLQQVVMNLVVNARDAMPDGGGVTIATANADVGENDDAIEPGRYVTLTVRDTGEGIDEQTLLQIFEPFFTTKDAGKGTGLGLATVYGIVKQSGGYVAVDSEVGVGSAFTIYLRRADGIVAAGRAGAEPAPRSAEMPAPVAGACGRPRARRRGRGGDPRAGRPGAPRRGVRRDPRRATATRRSSWPRPPTSTCC